MKRECFYDFISCKSVKKARMRSYSDIFKTPFPKLFYEKH